MARTLEMIAYVQWFMLGLSDRHPLKPRLERIEGYLIERFNRG